LGDAIPAGVLHGLKIVAVAVVAQAVWGMARSLCTDKTRILLMTLAACIALLVPSVWGQVGVILAAGIGGLTLLKPAQGAAHEALPIVVSHSVAIAALLFFAGLLIGLPVLAELYASPVLKRVDSFYRAGSLVFGGGHVVLPLLQAEVVPSGLVSNETFLAGYGVVQAMPGPLFTFAAFLGASMSSAPSGWLGGLICLIAIFIPSFLLIVGALPFWETLRRNQRAQAALAGINAAVVGLLLAALYQPAWKSAIFAPKDVALALAAFVALMFWKLPPWLVVAASGLLGWILATGS
jgi:chromate transporter